MRYLLVAILAFSTAALAEPGKRSEPPLEQKPPVMGPAGQNLEQRVSGVGARSPQTGGFSACETVDTSGVSVGGVDPRLQACLQEVIGQEWFAQKMEMWELKAALRLQEADQARAEAAKAAVGAPTPPIAPPPSPTPAPTP